MLQNALPALEKLHTAWDKAAIKPCYAPFVPALDAGMEKLDEYYQHTAAFDAHIMAMGKYQILLLCHVLTRGWQCSA
jgi:hypothetical protein